MTDFSDEEKASLIARVIAHLDDELSRYAQAARAAQADATDEQSRAENKYDTRGLEASYLARGQSRQALETVQAREQFAAMPTRRFGSDEPIELGALIDLENSGEHLLYLLGPSAGGTEVMHAGKDVLVITPASPLGRLLIGKRRGERVEINGNPRVSYRVAAVT